MFFMLRVSPSPQELTGPFLPAPGFFCCQGCISIKEDQAPSASWFSRVEARRTKETGRNLVISLSKRRLLKAESRAPSLTARLEDKPGTGYVSAWQLASYTIACVAYC